MKEHQALEFAAISYRGIQRILAECREAGIPAPEITYEPSDFCVEFSYSPEYLKIIFPAGASHSESGKGSEGARQRAPITPRSGEQVGEQVSEQVVRMLAACADEEQSKRTILASVGMANVYLNYKRHVFPLVERGFLERTIPDKPNSRLQKYRLTAKGRALLASRAKETDDD